MRGNKNGWTLLLLILAGIVRWICRQSDRRCIGT